jgi:hypothetical protein
MTAYVRHPPNKLMITCESYTAIHKNSLIGKADIRIAELRLTVKGVLILESHGRRWASLPSPAMIDRNGVALRGDDGKIKYSHVFEFDSREVRNAFSEAVIRAVLERAPHAFGEVV